jgi:RHS repeat-associated protein
MGKPAPHTPVNYVKGGGAGSAGAGGSGSGKGKKGKGKAPGYGKKPKAGAASDPVDVVTGRAYTFPFTILELPGPLPLEFTRTYSSQMAHRNVGLGFGWAHTFGWEIEVEDGELTVWNDEGTPTEFPPVRDGEQVIGPWGWLLRREGATFVVDADDDVLRVFTRLDERDNRYRLTSVEDRHHSRISLTWALGRLVEIKDSVGRLITVGASPEGLISSIALVAAPGQSIAFATCSYDTRGNLISVVDAEGSSWHYEYDGDHRLTAHTDRLGLTFHFVYDGVGRCIESWGDYGDRRDPSLAGPLPKYLADHVTPCKGIHHSRLYYYDDYYSEVADSAQVRRFFGNEFGLLDKWVEGEAVSTAAYDEGGNLVSMTDPLGATTSYDRDERGRLVEIVDPLGRATSISRDENGLPIEVEDAQGNITQIVRSPAGEILSVTDPVGAVTSAQYDERGLIVEIQDPRGGRNRFDYDQHGNCVAITDPNGATWRFTYDTLGRLLSQTSPVGAVTSFAYSLLGDVTAVYDATGGVAHYRYDGEGHLVEVLDQNGGRTSFEWGGFHRLCGRTDANGNQIRLRYNVEGELIEVHNERGEVHHLEYSPEGLLVAETAFDGRLRRYRYDQAGRKTVLTNGLGQTVRWIYDPAGQLVRRELGEGAHEEFEYDKLGLMTAVRWADGEEFFERDALGRIVREQQTTGTESHSVEVTYDADGNRSGRTTSLGHREVIERDAMGARSRTVLDGSTIIEHLCNPVGRELTRRLPQGGQVQSTFDVMGRLVQRCAVSPGTSASGAPMGPSGNGLQLEGVSLATSYRYDPTGELIERLDRQQGRTRYQYDPVGQLLSVLPERARAELFRYDATGNAHEDGPKAEAREYGRGNRLLRKGAVTYAWDGEGRLTEKRTANGTWSYRWNTLGLLESVTKPDATTVKFAYDPFARRVEKKVATSAAGGGSSELVSRTRFVWDGNALAHEVTEDAAGARVGERTYCFEDDDFVPLAHRDGAEWFHYVNDPIGTPDRLVSGDGLIACELERSAWGETTSSSPARTSTPLRFQGQYADAEVDLVYNRFRYFAPDLGQFVSADPLGLPGGLNDVPGPRNPLRWVDPLGLVNYDPATGLPILQVSQSATPTIHQNIQTAVQNGAPTTLSRADDAGKRQNRADALRGMGKRKKGQSLDEYPYASSQQGGGKAKGARVSSVPAREQNIQGGQMSSFYKQAGLKPGDPYIVKLVP